MLVYRLSFSLIIDAYNFLLTKLSGEIGADLSHANTKSDNTDICSIDMNNSQKILRRKRSMESSPKARSAEKRIRIAQTNDQCNGKKSDMFCRIPSLPPGEDDDDDVSVKTEPEVVEVIGIQTEDIDNSSMNDPTSPSCVETGKL